MNIPARVHQISSAAVVALALVHIGVVPIVFRRWTPGISWFIGTGLGLLLLGALNIALRREPSSFGGTGVCRLANFVALAYATAAVIASPEVQGVVAVIALAGQALSARVVLRRVRMAPGAASQV